MALPKVLSPSFWLDKTLRIFLQLVLAILLYILYLIKGEQVHVSKVEVTAKNAASKSNKVKNNMTTRSINVFNNTTNNINDGNKIITGTLTELKPDELDENLIVKKEISVPVALKNDNNDKLESEEREYDNNDKLESEEREYESIEEESINDDYRIVPNFEMKTSHIHNSSIMKSSDIISFKFHWKHGGNRVFVTGDFDNWSACEHEMTKIPNTNDFIAIVDIDRTKRHEFKFVIDGAWTCSWDFETCHDEHGNMNNVIYAAPSSDFLNSEYNDNVGFFNSHLTAAY